MNRRIVISVQDVRKSYGRKTVLRGGEMKANTGELICIVGENGSGKSTLLKIIAGFLKPDKGLVSRIGKMGYCPQQYLLYNYLTVEEHFQLFGAAYGMSKSSISKNSNWLMEIFSFKEYQDFKIHQLSGGTQQKLNLSLSLLHDPILLLLDEPYAGFDWESYNSFLEYAKLVVKQGKCVIMVSHLVYDKHHFDAVFNLNKGMINEETIYKNK